ncbi:hypothetical protein ACFCV9_06600 [Streptomyces sp. NPDC056367]|uniref:hypothetical protein n=1 Tax=unclassified Streptomyces TaxID=2593676 RepID=UPI0035D7C5E8
MAVLTTISVVLGAWCAAGIMTAALYAAVRGRRIRRQRAMASALEGPVAGPAKAPPAEGSEEAQTARAVETPEAVGTPEAEKATGAGRTTEATDAASHATEAAQTGDLSTSA